MNRISNKNMIIAFIHCGLCLQEWNNNPDIRTKMSPKEYAQTQAGWTKRGLQIWCNRHNGNIVNIDFQGVKHPANTSIKIKSKKDIIKKV